MKGCWEEATPNATAEQIFNFSGLKPRNTLASKRQPYDLIENGSQQSSQLAQANGVAALGRVGRVSRSTASKFTSPSGPSLTSSEHAGPFMLKIKITPSIHRDPGGATPIPGEPQRNVDQFDLLRREPAELLGSQIPQSRTPGQLAWQATPLNLQRLAVSQARADSFLVIGGVS